MSKQNIILLVVAFAVLWFCAAIAGVAFLIWKPVMHARAERIRMQGRAIEKTGYLPGAVVEYQQAIRGDPNDLEAYLDLASAQIRLREFDAALQVGDAALRTNPTKSTGFFIRGHAHECLRNSFKRATIMTWPYT